MQAGGIKPGFDITTGSLPGGNGPKSKKRPRRTAFLFFPEGTTGAGEGIRTLDPNLGKVVLYP